MCQFAESTARNGPILTRQVLPKVPGGRKESHAGNTTRLDLPDILELSSNCSTWKLNFGCLEWSSALTVGLRRLRWSRPRDVCILSDSDCQISIATQTMSGRRNESANVTFYTLCVYSTTGDEKKQRKTKRRKKKSVVNILRDFQDTYLVHSIR